MNKAGRLLFVGFAVMVVIIILSLASSRSSVRTEARAAHTQKVTPDR
jgi:hypothetical protein